MLSLLCACYWTYKLPGYMHQSLCLPAMPLSCDGHISLELYDQMDVLLATVLYCSNRKAFQVFTAGFCHRTVPPFQDFITVECIICSLLSGVRGTGCFFSFLYPKFIASCTTPQSTEWHPTTCSLTPSFRATWVVSIRAMTNEAEVVICVPSLYLNIYFHFPTIEECHCQSRWF